MNLRWLVGAWVLMVGLLATPALAQNAGEAAGQKIITVKDVEGISEEDARTQAVRTALEQYAKVELVSRSEVENFELIKDTVLTRASGLVSWVEGPKFRKGMGGTVFASGKVLVKDDIIDATWAEVQEAMKALGNPTIMFVYQEIIHDVDRPEANREIVQYDSQVRAMMSKLMADTGFDVVDGAQHKAIQKMREEGAKVNDDVGTLVSVAQDLGASIIVRGFSRAAGPEKVAASGVGGYVWATDLTMDAIWTDTARVICSEGVTNRKGGSTVPGAAGAADALRRTGEFVAPKFMNALLTQWSRQITGGGKIVLDVSNVPNIARAIRIQKQLEQLPGVKEINRKFNKGAAEFTITAETTAEKLTEAMVEIEDLPMEIMDQKGMRISAMYKEPGTE